MLTTPEELSGFLNPFSSLFVGMGLAIKARRPISRTRSLTFSSLFVGMGLAMNCYLVLQPGNIRTFSSLFVGMGLAIFAASS